MYTWFVAFFSDFHTPESFLIKLFLFAKQYKSNNKVYNFLDNYKDNRPTYYHDSKEEYDIQNE